MKRTIYLSILYLLAYTGINAQVGIDKDEVLSDSISVVYDYALLENLPIDSITVYKGAGMPRVRLYDAHKLQLGEGDDFTSKGKDHIGLTIYNDSDAGTLCPGFHTWNGEEWIPQHTITRPDLEVTDRDTNRYKAKWFGRNPCRGAYWMTTNLYTNQTAEGKPFATDPLINPAYSFGLDTHIAINAETLAKKTKITYGQHQEAEGEPNNVTQTLKEYIAEFGLLYNWTQANQACPEGWRLPSNEEWSELIALHGKPLQAAAGMRKHKHYYTTTDGQQMKWGRTDPPDTTLSGFDAVPAGNIYDQDAYYSYYWGTLTAWWTSARGISTHIRYDQTKVLTTRGFSDFYLSVRCVKSE